MRVPKLFLVVALGSCSASDPELGQRQLEGTDDEGAVVSFVEPAAGFSSDGIVDVKVRVALGFYNKSIQDPGGGPKGTGDVILLASVAGCDAAPVEVHIDPNQVDPIATNPKGDPIQGYYWTVSVDLSACRCQGGGGTITHHCDGCGRKFDTCEDGDGGACTAREVTLILDATNRPANYKCEELGLDFNGDGNADCDGLTGSLTPTDGGPPEELWVPAKFWEDNNTTCVRRANPQGECHPAGGDQGGHSCSGGDDDE